MTEIKRYCDICHREIQWQKHVWYELELTMHTLSGNDRKLTELCFDCSNSLELKIKEMKESKNE